MWTCSDKSQLGQNCNNLNSKCATRSHRILSCSLKYLDNRVRGTFLTCFTDAKTPPKGSWKLRISNINPCCCCCYSVAKWCLTLCNPMDCRHVVPLSFTSSPSLLRFMSVESVMLSNNLILCHSRLLLPSTFPSIRVFSNVWLFTSCGQNIWASASALTPVVLPWYLTIN